MRIALVACRPHRYAGRMLVTGEVFYVKGQDDARVLKAIGAAKDAPAAGPVAPLVEPPAVVEPPVENEQKRVPEPAFTPDPTPEPSPEPEPAPAPAPEPAPEDEPTRRRRAYRRRDLEAEDTSS